MSLVRTSAGGMVSAMLRHIGRNRIRLKHAPAHRGAALRHRHGNQTPQASINHAPIDNRHGDNGRLPGRNNVGKTAMKILLLYVLIGTMALMAHIGARKQAADSDPAA